MADEVKTGTEGTPEIKLEPKPETPAVAPVPKPKDEGKPEWLDARLEQARTSAEKALLTKLGIVDVEDAKKKLDALKKIEDERKTAEERAADQLSKYTQLQSRNSVLESTISRRAAVEMGVLDAAKQEAVKAIAGEDPADQLRAIDALKPTWVQTPTAPATPLIVSTGPSGKDVPTPAGANTTTNHRSVYEDLRQKNPLLAAQYAAEHANEVYPDLYK